MEEKREQIWGYRLDGQVYVTPSESYAATRDQYAWLIYETSRHD